MGLSRDHCDWLRGTPHPQTSATIADVPHCQIRYGAIYRHVSDLLQHMLLHPP